MAKKFFLRPAPYGAGLRALLLAAAFLLCPLARAQLTYVSAQTTISSQTNVTTAQRFIVPNLGQITHAVTYTLSAPVTAFRMRIEYSNDGVTFFPISADAVDAAGGTSGVYAFGYYPVVAVNVLVITGGSVSFSYVGTGAASGTPLGVFQGSYPAKQLIVLNGATSSGVSSNFPTLNGSTAGRLYLQCAAACPAATLTVFASPSQSASIISQSTLLSTTLAANATLQTFDVAGVPANYVSVTIAAGGATTYTAFFQFAQPGATQQTSDGSNPQIVRTCAVFKTVTATASGNTALWTPTSGKKFRLMRYSVSVPGNALFATTAGPVTITFNDGGAAWASPSAAPVYVVQVPTAAITGEEFTSGWLDLGNGYLSSAVNNVLNVNLTLGGTGAFSGGIIVNTCGTEE